MRKPLYFDYAATTPMDPRVAEAMGQCFTLDGNFGNPASRSHYYGWKAEEAVENARSQVAELIGADPREIVWTSGATESNNLAIKGMALAQNANGRHIVTAQTEHKAVLDTCSYLASQGYEVTYLPPNASGLVAPDAVAAALRDDTVLVSLMHVNNETGVITDLAAVSALCRARGIPLHVDAAQSVGKLPVDVAALGVDLLSISAHKMYGPKGVGALYVRRNADWQPVAQIHGGGHERGMRSGTLATHQVVGFGAAAKIASAELGEESERILALRNRFLEGVQSLSDVQVNGCLEQHVPGTLNISFGGLDGESLLLALRDLAISTGSACTSASVAPSYVLKAMGLSDAAAHSALRFSVGRFTSEQDVDFAINKVCSVVTQMRRSAGPATPRPLVGAP